MGSQSSSGMSGRGSSDNPDQSEPESNQNTNPRGRRSTDRQSERQSAAEEDVDLAQVLAYLLRRYAGAPAISRELPYCNVTTLEWQQIPSTHLIIQFHSCAAV